MMLIDSNLLDYYKTTFRLQKDFGFDMAHIETMFPFEYKIYVQEVLQYVEEERKRYENQKSKR